jgi:hypothetical protein
MKRPIFLCSSLLLALSLPVAIVRPAQAQIRVIDIVPNSQSNETGIDSEPNVAVDPSNPQRIAASAFTPDPMGGPNAPIYVSTDGGTTWTLNSIVPGNDTTYGTGDITLRFGGTSGVLYTGILLANDFLHLNLLRAADFTLATPMIPLVDRFQEDQPYVQATTVLSGSGTGNDRVYIGNNNLAGSQSATIDLSLDAATAAAPAGFSPFVVETRTTSGQDGPPVRTAIHPDGTVYGIFYHWTHWFPGTAATADVVVVRADGWGTGATPFAALQDGGLGGKQVVTGRTIPWGAGIGQNRFVGSNLSIAVDPRKSDQVYIAWADRVGATDYTLHVRGSSDRGVTWSPSDLLTITNATNPALAINTMGRIGFLYQQVTGTGPGQRWQTHLRRSDDGTTWTTDDLLADTPANTPPSTSNVYLGDYDHLMAVGKDFYGIFSAANMPVLANFPSGVTFQRNVDIGAGTLRNVTNTGTVSPSIDPFFFSVMEPEPQIQVPGSVALGKTCVGATSAGSLAVCNTGKADLIVSSITSSSPAFSVTTPSAGYPVTISHDFCFPFQLVLAPAATGPQSATLAISSNDPKTPVTSVPVSGDGSEPDIRVTGSTDFGVTSAWTPAERTVAVCNTGGCNLSVTAASTSCADFTLIDSPFPATLNPGSCLNLVVRFTPHLYGSKTCQLKVASDDPDSPLVSRTLTATTPPLFSLHTGLVEPHGAFHAVARQGSTLNLDFVYPFKPQWAWDVRLGDSRFDGRAGHPDTGVATLSVNAKFTITPASPVRLFLNGGLGLYHFNPGDFEGGGNLGLGLGVPLGRRFVLEATYNYHSAFTATPKLNFSQIQLGLLVSF